jgi:type III secretory pathway component EscU
MKEKQGQPQAKRMRRAMRSELSRVSPNPNNSYPDTMILLRFTDK